jgi:hypothetical protein
MHALTHAHARTHAHATHAHACIRTRAHKNTLTTFTRTHKRAHTESMAPERNRGWGRGNGVQWSGGGAGGRGFGGEGIWYTRFCRSSIPRPRDVIAGVILLGSTVLGGGLREVGGGRKGVGSLNLQWAPWNCMDADRNGRSLSLALSLSPHTHTHSHTHCQRLADVTLKSSLRGGGGGGEGGGRDISAALQRGDDCMASLDYEGAVQSYTSAIASYPFVARFVLATH